MSESVINYYECNKDSIWIASIIILIMIIFITILKLFVYNELHKALNVCSPFSYYVGDKSACTRTIQENVILQNTTTEHFENASYVGITDIFQDVFNFIIQKWVFINNYYLAITKNISMIFDYINTQIQTNYDKLSSVNKNIQYKIIYDYIDPMLYKSFNPFIKLYKTMKN